MEQFIFRKSKNTDVKNMAELITNLLGTCDLDEQNFSSKEEILQRNILHVEKYIDNYFVCVHKNMIIGLCGISEFKHDNIYDIKNLSVFREILYLVVDKNFQKKGIGSKLLSMCCKNIQEPILYEAWGDGEYVNLKFLLKKSNLKLLKDLGSTYYKNHGYCNSCVNRNKNCESCHAEIWIKNELK